MLKTCVICGAQFTAPPSSKKITCSRACSTARKRMSHTNVSNTWNGQSRAALSARMKDLGYTPAARHALEAAMALPESQRGPLHRDAKIWTLIDPDGNRHHVVNLLNWAREHAEIFDAVADDADRERVANNIRSGFGGIAQSMMGRRKNPCFSYKGWRLGDWPRDKDEEESL